MRNLSEFFGGPSEEERAVGQWLDGDHDAAGAAREAMAQDPELAAYARDVSTMREGIEAMPQAPAIDDAQMPAFLTGLKERVADEPRVSGGWPMRYALPTATAMVAAIAVAFGLFIMVSGGHTSVEARTEVQEYATELPGATIEVNDGVLVISDAGVR